MKEHTGAPNEFARGVEITAAHGAVDWRSAADSGIKFGYLTATRGLAEEDPRHLAANWRGMKDAGILRGGCHYLRPLKNIESQARQFGEALSKLGAPELPAAVRIKTVPTQSGVNEWEVVPPQQRIELLLRWLEIVEGATGRKCVLATNAGFIQRHLSEAARLTDRDLWVADYRASGELPAPRPWTRWTFWRYSETGQLAGAGAPVCLNYFNGSRSELDRYASVDGTSEPEPPETQPVAGKPDVEEQATAAVAVNEPEATGEGEKPSAPKGAESSRSRANKPSKQRDQT